MLPCVVRLPPLSLIRARLTVARPANRTDMALIEDPKFSPWVKKCASSWFSRHVLSTLHSPDPVSRSRRRRGPRGVLRRLCQGAPCSLHVTVPRVPTLIRSCSLAHRSLPSSSSSASSATTRCAALALPACCVLALMLTTSGHDDSTTARRLSRRRRATQRSARQSPRFERLVSFARCLCLL